MSRSLLGHQLQGHGGEVVLLLNGGMMTCASWQPVMEPLVQNGFRTLGCDFRGQLMTPGPAHRRLEDNIPDVLALLDALKLDRVHMLGTSFGGEIAVLLAALHADRVKSLAAVTAADRTPPGMAESSQKLQAAIQASLEGSPPMFFHDLLIADFYSDAYRQSHADQLAERQRRTADLPAAWYQGLIGILASIQSFDLHPLLSKIVCPTLVVHAGQDRIMPSNRVKALAAGIADAELLVHPGSGHALVVEDPQWLGRKYQEFLCRQLGENRPLEPANGP